jgi:hypothetical protein
MIELVGWLDNPCRLSFLVSLACLHPIWRIFRRAGLSPWPALLVFVPVFGLAIVGSILAFRPWPNVPPRKPKQR